MAHSICDNCGNDFHWNWEEAFDKFGFNDGDGQIETHQVETVLIQHGFTVECEQWAIHNTVITSIQKDGQELIPEGVECGYDDARSYLPQDIIAILDEAFS